MGSHADNLGGSRPGYATILGVREAGWIRHDVGCDADRRSCSGCHPKLTRKPLFPMYMNKEGGGGGLCLPYPSMGVSLERKMEGEGGRHDVQATTERIIEAVMIIIYIR